MGRLRSLQQGIWCKVLRSIAEFSLNVLKFLILVLVIVLIGFFLKAGYKVSDLLATLSYVILVLLLAYIIIEILLKTFRVSVGGDGVGVERL